MIGKTVTHYRILEKLGQGGMGVVYKAQDIKLDRLVALKFLPHYLTSDPAEKERFVREARAASALSHANITTVHEIDEFEGQIFIVMEYVEGRTLKQVIKQDTLSLEEILDIGIDVCDGLNAAHERNMVHRDIKSDNIMLTAKGQVKIMDFGLAELKEASEPTRSGSTAGTAAYMSPEQAQGQEVDQRSDIFSVGVVLYELLTGRLPFEGEHQAAIVYSILTEDPQPVARFNNQVSDRLENVVFKALAKDREERYHHIDDLLTDLRREHKALEYARTGRIPPLTATPRSKIKLPAILVPASIVFAIVLLLLILRPFRFEIGPAEKTVAEENTLAVMHFENLKDREDKTRIGEMISELLITGLSESRYMRVVSSQRLFDILKMMGREGMKIVDRTVASEVARRAHAKYMLLGTILSAEPELVITSQLVDVESGNVIASQRISGPDGVNIFTLVDSLTYEIKKDLDLPLLARKEEKKPVADITTHSPEALRLYLEGNELYYKFYMKEAAEKLERAVEIDTTFASAYLKLAFCYSSLQDNVKATAFVEKAVRFADKVSKKERLLIDAFHRLYQFKYQEAKSILEQMVKRYPDEKIAHENLAHVNYTMNNYDEAIIGYNKVIELDSLNKWAYNMLAYNYDEVGQYDEAIRAINKYIELAPYEANPYDSRGDIYARHSEVDKAIDSYSKALEIKSDFTASIQKLGFMYLYKREYEKAERYFQRYGDAGTKADKSISRANLALIPLAQGKYDMSLSFLEKALAADDLDGLKIQQVSKHLRMAIIYVHKKEFEKSLQHGKRLIGLMQEAQPENVFIAEIFYGMFLALAGEVDSAAKISDQVKKEIQDKTEGQKRSWYFLEYLIQYHKGNIDRALKIAKLAEDDFRIRFWRAKTYLEVDMIAEAAQEFETLSRWNILTRVANPVFSTEIRYFLGMAYERSGWNQKAIQQYEKFLDIMRDADPGIAEVEDAKKRLEKLRLVS